MEVIVDELVGRKRVIVACMGLWDHCEFLLKQIDDSVLSKCKVYLFGPQFKEGFFAPGAVVKRGLDAGESIECLRKQYPDAFCLRLESENLLIVIRFFCGRSFYLEREENGKY